MPKRKPIPLRAKLEACLRLLGLPPDVEWDHCPALQLRPIRPDGTDWEPGQHDPAHLEPLTKAAHLLKTTGRKGLSKLSITGNGDVSRIAKGKRLRGETKPKPKRPWPQGRKIESRNDLRRR